MCTSATSIEAQQERAESADTLDDQEQIRRESEVGDTSFMTGFAGDGRQDTTGDIFGNAPDAAPAPAATPKETAIERRNRLIAEQKQAESPSETPETPANVETGAPARRKPSKAIAERAAKILAARADYFTPGNIVQGNSGFDEVLAYEANEGGGFKVTVHEVKKVGDKWHRVGKPQDRRQHSTLPESRQIAAGPVARLGYTPAAEVVYTSPRSDGQPFPNAVDRGTAPTTPNDLIRAPDGGVNFGEITPEMGKAMLRQPGKIRLTRGIQNANGTGYGLVHIEANHGKQIRALGFGTIEEFVAQLAGGIQQVWQVPGNSQLLVTAKNGRKDVMYIRLEIAKEGDFYRVNSAFPVRQRNYEAQRGMKKIWDGSEPTSAVTGQRPAFATAAIAAPDSESSQGSSNASGQDSSVSAASTSMQAGDAAAAPAVSANTIFTEDAAEKARARLKAKLGRLNSGVDPEMLMDGITLAGYHIEKGARTFAAFARAMVDDLGEGVKPYLQSWYMAVRADPRAVAFRPDMEKASAVEDLDVDAVLAESAKAPARAADAQTETPDANTLTESIYQAITDGNMPKDNPALKKLVESFDGKPADQARMKQAQEELETAIAMAARDIVAKNEGDRATFDALLRLYESQPNLNIRTSTSIANQAYSTPAPLAFLASRLAGITQDTVAHEPTGGTGMLLIGADPKKAIVNELNDLRISALKLQGFAPTQLDAATQRLVPEGVQPDAVTTNPPFGSIKDAAGKPIKVKVDGFNLGQIDHLIAARALDTMKADGKATLILGANKVQGSTERSLENPINAEFRSFYYCFVPPSVPPQFAVW